MGLLRSQPLWLKSILFLGNIEDLKKHLEGFPCRSEGISLKGPFSSPSTILRSPQRCLEDEARVAGLLSLSEAPFLLVFHRAALDISVAEGEWDVKAGETKRRLLEFLLTGQARHGFQRKAI